MPDKSNKLSQFWNELKRRKVFRVVAMYAATAFILLEVIDIIVPALLLPSWTVTLVVVLMAIGFPIAAILAWIFDITPEGVKKTESIEEAKEQKPSSEPVRRKLRAGDVIIAVLIVVVGILAYPKIFNKDKFEDIRDTDGRISIAIMPFENQTGDTTLNWFQRGMSSLIVNGLGSSTELAVRDEQSVYEIMENSDQIFTAGISNSHSRKVAEKIRAETFISGSFQGREGNYWIMANLVNTTSGDIIWTHKVEGDLESSGYLDPANSLCNEIKNYLEIKALEEDADYDFRKAFPESAEAYRFYIEGMNLILKNQREPAVESLKKALEIDSTFTFASFFIAYSYDMIYPPDVELTDIWIKKAYETKHKLPLKYQYWLEAWYTVSFSKSRPDLIRYLNLLEESGIDSRIIWFDLATTYHSFLGQYDKSIKAFEKVEELSKQRYGQWKYARFYQLYSDALRDAGKYDKEKEIHDLSLSLFTDNINKREIYWRQAIWALSQKDTIKGKEFLDKYISIKKEIGETKNIEYWIGVAYKFSNMPVEAAVHFRKAIKQNPNNDNYILVLARLLIFENINVNEGMVMIQELLDKYPQSIGVQHSKGWGCYKLGRYEESLQLLNRAEELGRTAGFYFPTGSDSLILAQIQVVEQALANQNQ